MIKLLKFLITGSWHEHKWKFVEEVEVYQGGNYSMPVYRKHKCVCETCGVWKSFKL